MQIGEVYGMFVSSVYVFDFVVPFCIFFAYCKKKADSASLFTVGIIENIIISGFNF